MASLLAVPPAPSPVPPPQPAPQQAQPLVNQPDIVTPRVQQQQQQRTPTPTPTPTSTPTPTTLPQHFAHQPFDEVKPNIMQNQTPIQQQQQPQAQQLSMLPQQLPAVTTTVPLSQPSPSIPTTAPNIPHQQNTQQNNNQRQIHNQNQNPNPIVQQNGIKKQPELQQQHQQQQQHHQQYLDPLEHSLASLEQSFKSELPPNSQAMMNAVAQNNLLNDFTLGLAKQNSMDLGHAHLMAQLQGLGPDMAGLMNNTNKSDGFLPSHNGYMKQEILHDPMQLSTSLSNALGLVMPPVSSIFDPLPTIPVSHQSMIQQPPLMMPASTIMPPMHIKEEKPMITPKPIEDLIGVPSMNERVKYEEKKNNSSNQRQEEKPMSNNFSAYQAFKPKQEQNVKNATSWSLLAQAGSPQGSNVQVAQQSKPKPTMDSFQASLNHLLRVLSTF